MLRRGLLIVAALLLVAAVAVPLLLPGPPATPPDYAGERPDPVLDGALDRTASMRVAVPPNEFRSWVNAPGRELGDLVRSADASLAVVGAEPLRGTWDASGDRTGDRRRVQFADGHYLAEEVLVDNPDQFRYVIWGFTGMQRLAVRHAVAEFRYTAVAGGTEVTWTYAVVPTSPLVRPALQSYVDSSLASLMRDTLEAMRTGAESAR